jgi:hypothetical protein
LKPPLYDVNVKVSNIQIYFSSLGFGIKLIEEFHNADFDEQLQGMGCTCGF